MENKTFINVLSMVACALATVGTLLSAYTNRKYLEQTVEDKVNEALSEKDEESDTEDKQ